MTPAEFRKRYRFPEKVEHMLEWRFYPLHETRPSHYRYIRFVPFYRKFTGGLVECDGNIEDWTSIVREIGRPWEDTQAVETMRSFLPACALAQCAAFALLPTDAKATLGPITFPHISRGIIIDHLRK